MKHGYFGRKLGRNANERRSLFMQLMRSLISFGRIKTTQAKAKAIQPAIDKLITKAKKGSNADINEMRKSLSLERHGFIREIADTQGLLSWGLAAGTPQKK